MRGRAGGARRHGRAAATGSGRRRQRSPAGRARHRAGAAADGDRADDLRAPTAYRNWVNKNELIDELFEQSLDDVAALAERALEDPDAWHGLTTFLEQSLRLQLKDRGLSELLHNPEMGLQRLNRSRDRLAPMINAMADRAKRDGSMRPDAEGTDIVWIQVALTALMDRTRRLAPELYRRYLTLL